MCLLSVWLRGDSRGSSQDASPHVGVREDEIGVSVEPLIHVPSPHPAFSIRLSMENTSKRLFLHFWGLIPTRGTGILSITLPSWGDSRTPSGQQATDSTVSPSDEAATSLPGSLDLPQSALCELESMSASRGGLVLCERVPLAT